MVGQMIFQEKVGELSLFVLQEETQGWSNSSLCLCKRKLPFLVVAENIMGQQIQIMAWETEINLMFKTVTKS